MKRAALVLAVALASSSCSLLQPAGKAEGLRVSPDYVATGEVRNLRAFVYGGKTVLDAGSRVAWLNVYDAEGQNVPVEKIGRYYRVGVRLDSFTVRVNWQRASFELVPALAGVSNQGVAAARLKPLRVTATQESAPGGSETAETAETAEKRGGAAKPNTAISGNSATTTRA